MPDKNFIYASSIHGLMPSVTERIQSLKKEKDVLIMAHNYQSPSIQDIADIVGDSLVLARQAITVEQRIILFCGVDFMAESTKILSPEKTVIHPNIHSKCPMAGMVDPEELEKMKQDHPGAPVVSYINTTASIKCLSDVCVTSANAVDIVKNLDAQEVIFVPDVNLGMYVQRFVPEKKIHLWPGYCHVHQDITTEQIKEARREHPGAEVLVHPECTPQIIDMADAVFSTEGMLRHVQSSPKEEFILATEEGLAYRINTVVPSKKTYPVTINTVCPNMKKISLEDVLNSLETLLPTIELDDDTIACARAPLDRMVEVKRRG